MDTIGTIIPPPLPEHLPKHCKWLSGQGAGTWFCVDETADEFRYRIRRYTPEGELNCDRIFVQEDRSLIFDVNLAHEFVHISHCSICRIKQNNQVFIFNNIQE